MVRVYVLTFFDFFIAVRGHFASEIFNPEPKVETYRLAATDNAFDIDSVAGSYQGI